MTLNPAAASGLEACTVAQARIHSETFGVACPVASELGTVSLEVPTLPPGSLTGSMYLGGPVTGSETAPITGPPYILYVVANSARYGVSVRLKGEVIPNEATGQLTTVFKENPEQPFSKLTLSFNRGALTSVANPLICGTPTGTASLTPVATEGVPTANDPFGVTITGCAASIPFSLGQSTQYAPTTAAAHSSYVFNLGRAEGQQYLQKVSTTLPSGVVGEIPDGDPLRRTAGCAGHVRLGKSDRHCDRDSRLGQLALPVLGTCVHDRSVQRRAVRPVDSGAGGRRPVQPRHDRDTLDDQHRPLDGARDG